MHGLTEGMIALTVKVLDLGAPGLLQLLVLSGWDGYEGASSVDDGWVHLGTTALVLESLVIVDKVFDVKGPASHV